MNAKVKRLGLFGGTFNPVHFGHLLAARSACDALELDRLLFIPTGHPPKKECGALVSPEHRASMVFRAIQDDARFAMSDIEIRREGKSFTIDTVRQLAAEQGPDVKLYFVLGDDSALNLPRWKGIEELQQLAEFVSVHRNGGTVQTALPKMHHVFMPTVEISSSQLRCELSAGRSIEGLTPSPVIEYIAKNGLYGPVGQHNTEMT